MSTMNLSLPHAIQEPDGSWTKEVEIDEMTGEEEDILTDLTRASGGTGTYQVSGPDRITKILSRCTVRIGNTVRTKDRFVEPDFFLKAWK